MTALDTLCTELLSISLTQRPRSLSQPFADETWLALPAYAARNRVGALLFEAIPLLTGTTTVPRQCIMALALQAEACEGIHSRHRAALQELQQLTGSKPALLKGFALASLYSRPDHREATDIDIFCGEHTVQLAALLQQHGIACDSKNPRHLTFVLRGVLIEAHRYLFYNAHDRNHFAGWESTATERLPLARHTLFFLAHTAYDAVFFDLPIAWRTCCDWLLLLRRMETQPAVRAQFEQELRGATFERFAQAFTRSCYLRFPLVAEGLALYNSEPYADGTCRPDSPLDEAFHRDTFWQMFRNPRPRPSQALPRAARRIGKYLRYNRYYKALFGQNMFRIFYLHNLWTALWQRHKGRRP